MQNGDTTDTAYWLSFGEGQVYFSELALIDLIASVNTSHRIHPYYQNLVSQDKYRDQEGDQRVFVLVE